MILYKYYSYDAGISALKNEKLGFRNPENFNDPFEFTVLSNISSGDSSQLRKTIDGLKKNVAVLSLSRTFDNPLMWAHYGQEHTGFVIGYEVDGPFLNDKQYNIISAHEGDVLYTGTKISNSLDEVLVERLHKIFQVSHGINLNDLEKFERTEIENLLRRILLVKHVSWVYEEEVRIIKTPHPILKTSEEINSDPFLKYSSVTIDVAPSYGLITIPGFYLYENKAKIKEVYLGIRNPLVNEIGFQRNIIIEEDTSLVDKAAQKKWEIKQMVMEEKSWQLTSISINYEKLKIIKYGNGLLNRFNFNGIEAGYLKLQLSKQPIHRDTIYEFTNWCGKPYLKINGRFVGISSISDSHGMISQD